MLLCGVAATGVQVNCTLTSLGLWDNSFGEKGASAISDALKVLLPRLRWPCSVVMCVAIQVNRALTSVTLNKNLFGTEGSVAISDALKVWFAACSVLG